MVVSLHSNQRTCDLHVDVSDRFQDIQTAERLSAVTKLKCLTASFGSARRRDGFANGAIIQHDFCFHCGATPTIPDTSAVNGLDAKLCHFASSSAHARATCCNCDGGLDSKALATRLT